MKKLLSNIRTGFTESIVTIVIVALVAIIVSFITFGQRNEDGSYTFDGKPANISQEQKDALCAIKNETKAESQALSGIDVPQDATSGCEPTDLAQMGSLTYYKVGVSTPTTFYSSVNGKGFNEGYGLQCVAGFKEFMYSLSDKYVAAAGGGAKGYATQQAQIEPLGFKWHTGTAGLQNGDWGIWTNGQYGHVAMYYNSQWFGQNQYASNPNVGNAFNLANVSTNGLAGYYRPNIYQNQAPTPEPGTGENTGSTGTPGSSTASAYTVMRGDTLGGISLNLGWWPSTTGLYGNGGYAQRLAEGNGITDRGLIYPSQVINRVSN